MAEGSVVITGSSTGIGKACALDLDKRGFRVFAGVRKEADGEALKAEASERLVPVMIDVTDVKGIAGAVKAVEEAVGEAGLYGLVNNAGIAVAAPMEFIPMDRFEEQMRVNVTGQVAVTQAFMPLIRKAKGRIVNIGSDNGKLTMPFNGAYCMSKHAMESFSDALRIELKPFGIQVVLIEPGSIDTPIWEKSVADARRLLEELPDEAGELYEEEISAMFRIAGKMEDMAEPVEKVTKVVARALESPRPRTRYVVALDGKINVFMARWLPDRTRDWVVMKIIKYFVGD
jgi:NAD(P)-dependent dehydrogenase (short-subunit alcohol dehydrogenase family)